MSDMNEFQRLALAEVSPVLHEFGIDANFVPSGSKPGDFELMAKERDLHIWIYRNEVAFWLRSFRLQCEVQDFDTSTEMITFWADSLRMKLREESH